MRRSDHKSALTEAAPGRLAHAPELQLVSTRSNAETTPGPEALYLAQLAPGSRRAAAFRLGRCAELAGLVGPVEWGKTTYAQAVEIRGRAAEAYAPRTASAIVAALRAVCRVAWRVGDMEGEEYHRICDLPPIRGESAPVGRYVARGELRALFGACGAGPGGDRDRLLLAILFGAGLRRAELCDLTEADIVAEGAGALVVVRRGKGRKGRRVPVGAAVWTLTERWLGSRGPGPGPLLCSVTRGGRLSGRALSGEAVRQRLATLAARAGVGCVRPHDARRSFASDLLDRGVDLAVVARLLGHASIQVTAGYDRRGEVAARDAADLVSLPVDL